MHKKVAIIGSGPAGLTAAIYTSRAMLDTVVIGGRAFGGQLMQTTEVENFPGFTQGIMGPELMQNMRLQAERFNTTLLEENVVSLDTSKQPFTLRSENQTITADAVILAMGADHQHLGLPSEERLSGHGVSYCATCDGFFFRGKDVAVIGGGDSAMEEALFLTKFAAKVFIIHRRDEFRASKIMVEKARSNPKIQFMFNTTVTDVLGDAKVTGVKLQDTQTKKESELPLSGVFVAVGLVPNSKFLAGTIDVDPRGYIVTHGDYKTSVEGVFVAGDVHDHKYRQAITAAGFGCAAALEAERYLSREQEKSTSTG